MNPAQAIQIALLLPLAGAVLCASLRRHSRLLAASGPLLAAATTAVLATQLAGVRGGARPSFNLVQLFPEVWLGFRLEPLGLGFALIVAGSWIPASVYAGAWARSTGEPRAARLLGCTALAVALLLGAALARNLLTLCVFLELACLACFPLVAHAGDEPARRAARAYLAILLGAAGALLFPALVWTFHLCGTLELRPGGILAGRVADPQASALLALFACGLAPAALLPGHRWLVAAMAAPTPAAGFPIAAVLAQTGAFALVQVATLVFGSELLAEVDAVRWIGWWAALTVAWTAARAFRARDLKRLLAYATACQLGTLALGALAASRAGMPGSGLHLAAHATGVLTLFLCAGHLERAPDGRQIVGRARTGWKAATWIAYACGALALAGSEWQRMLPAGRDRWNLAAIVAAVGALAIALALLAVPLRAVSLRSRTPAERPLPLACTVATCSAALAGCALLAFAGDIAAFLAQRG